MGDLIVYVGIRAAAGFVATWGFAVLFNVPRKVTLYSALFGMLGIIVRTLLMRAGVSQEVATFIAALIIGLSGFWVAHRLWMPRMIFTVTGIIPLIPGVPAYQVLLYFSQGDVLGGLASGVRAGLITGAIALGLSGARIITDFEQQTKP